jgi:hypothetical protein
MSALGGTKLANPLTTNVFYGSLGSAKSFTFTLIALSICGSSQTRITLGVDVRHSRFATSDNAQSSAVSDRERGLVLGAARPSISRATSPGVRTNGSFCGWRTSVRITRHLRPAAGRREEKSQCRGRAVLGRRLHALLSAEVHAA